MSSSQFHFMSHTNTKHCAKKNLIKKFTQKSGQVWRIQILKRKNLKIIFIYQKLWTIIIYKSLTLEEAFLEASKKIYSLHLTIYLVVYFIVLFSATNQSHALNYVPRLTNNNFVSICCWFITWKNRRRYMKLWDRFTMSSIIRERQFDSWNIQKIGEKYMIKKICWVWVFTMRYLKIHPVEMSHLKFRWWSAFEKQNFFIHLIHSPVWVWYLLSQVIRKKSFFFIFTKIQ